MMLFGKRSAGKPLATFDVAGTGNRGPSAQRRQSSTLLHILLKLSNRFTFAPFLRALAGTIALKVTGANKLNALKEKFWDFIPWSRIVEWGRAFKSAKDYIFQNEMEACGARAYQPRKKSSSPPPPKRKPSPRGKASPSSPSSSPSPPLRPQQASP